MIEIRLAKFLLACSDVEGVMWCVQVVTRHALQCQSRTLDKRSIVYGLVLDTPIKTVIKCLENVDIREEVRRYAKTIQLARSNVRITSNRDSNIEVD